MVGYIQREVLARFRHRRFLCIQELNDAIIPEIRRLNMTNLQSQNFSRHDRFIETERDQLLGLPRSKFNFGTWSTIRARSDYHVKVGTSYYSVPWRLANIRLRVKLTVNTVEIYQANTPVAIHARSMADGSYITTQGHMTPNHLGYTRSNSVPHLLEKIALIGPSATAFAELVLSNRRSEGLAISSLVQITDVARKYSSSAAEASCAHALRIGATKSSSVESIARRSLYESDPCDQTNTVSIAHENIRGPHYYQGDGNVS